MRRLDLHKGHTGLYALLLAAAVLTMIMMRNCSLPTWHVHDRRAGGDTLNVAIELSPIGLSTRGDTLSGFYYDMICRLASQHNRALKIEGYNNLDSVLEALENGRYDVVIGDVPTNTMLRERFRTTHPVLIDRQVLVQLRDSDNSLRYPSLFDLPGDTVYVPSNSPFKTRMEHLQRELGDSINIVEVPNMSAELLIILVAKGELPNAVVNKQLSEIMKLDYPMLDGSVNISFNQFQSWLVNKKDSILCDTLNSWIDGNRQEPMQ